jgi:bifunctional oligoribonuclease and PAP phosphatase NrnA
MLELRELELNEKDIFNKIKSAKTIALFIHINPDGDCLGSGVALKIWLDSQNKKCDVYCDDIVHDNYSFFVSNYVQNCDIKQDYDLLIALDCGDINRLSKYSSYFSNHKNTINIDHHISNTKFAKLNYIKDCSSTCEILYTLFENNNIAIDNNIALPLYCGLATDTGCFMHNNTTPNVHIIASKLLSFGLDIEKIHYFLFQRKTLNQINLMQVALTHFISYYNGELTILYLTAKDFEQTLTNERDVMGLGIVNLITNIDKVRVGVVISESKTNCYSVSFRSQGNDDVTLIASNFGGGGHKKASGCKIFGTKNTVIKKIVDAYKDIYAGNNSIK